MATTALGPTMAGGIQPIDENGYSLIYYPDVNNDALQREGKPPVFYYLPNYVHLARKDGKPDKPLMFNLARFAGVTSAETTVGVVGEGTREVAGGVLSFTTTAAPPTEVLIASQKKITSMFEGKNDFFWGIRANRTPIFRPVIVISNLTHVSNVSPTPQGTYVLPAGPATGGTPANGGSPQPTGPRAAGAGTPIVYKEMAVPEYATARGFNQKYYGKRRDGGTSTSSVDPWFWEMQGQGNGSIDPMGQNAYSALIGSYPASILWASFHGNYSPIFVQQNLKVKFWVPSIEITIRGNWDRVFEHFSAAASVRYLWFSADIQAEFNNMRINGTIEVDVKIDATVPGGEAIERYVNERTTLVYEKFMEQAKQRIFDPPQPEVQAAQASAGGILPWGAGLSLKYRRDETHLDLYYHEKRQMSYLQDHTISSSLEGMAEEIREDPEREKLYFQTIYMDDWPRKLGRIVKPIVNWPKPDQNWVGEPVSFVSAQIGYPNTAGEKMWVGKTFQKSDPADASWHLTMTQKLLADMTTIPEDWAPDKTYVKRTVHFLEAPDPLENPFVRVQIDDNQIDVDPEGGTLMDDVAIEVRADDVSRIKVGPVALNVELEDSRQVVEVYMRAIDGSGNVLSKVETVRFSFNNVDQATGRFWSVYSADKTIESRYEYQVRVIVKGSLFTKGMEWLGPWRRSVGSGPLMISVPTPEDEGVTVVREYRGNAAAPAPAPANGTPPAANGQPLPGPVVSAEPPRAVPLESRTYMEIK
ncbi:hypothetical protein GCM10023091_23260 [Ravibacter arvi]|uniref:Uncharacterized protein n=1 Tax=Ravibacter arvi TaxID=2051041 RepID=A0ABP8M019_9BACT